MASAAAWIFKWYLLFLTAFEFVPLYKLWGQQLPLHSLTPLIAAHNSNDDARVLFSLILGILIVVRFSGFVAGARASGAHHLAIVLMHAMEVVAFVPLYLTNVYPRRHLMAGDKLFETEFTVGVMIANPLVFAALAIALTSRTTAKTRKSE